MIEGTPSFVHKRPNWTAMFSVFHSTNLSLALEAGIYMYLYELTRYREMEVLWQENVNCLEEPR